MKDKAFSAGCIKRINDVGIPFAPQGPNKGLKAFYPNIRDSRIAYAYTFSQ